MALCFVASGLLNLFFVFQQLILQRELENLNNRLSQFQLPQMEAVIRNMVVDLAVYGQKQPAIFSVLKKYGVNSSPPPPPSAASRASPAPGK